MQQPTVLTIAGSDSSGGAGIQADLKTISANGGYAASVITAVTAQNTLGVRASETVSEPLLRGQLEAVFDDLEIAAVKTGMLGPEPVIRIVARALESRGLRHVVCDPVMVATSGDRLLPASSVEALKRELLPLAGLVTPNVAEASALSGIEIGDPRQAERAGRMILEYGCGAVLVKGGHLREEPGTDVLVTAQGSLVFPGVWLESGSTHGTGCIYSAAIATQLALGLSLERAIDTAKSFVTEAIRHASPIGRGIGPPDPFFFLRQGVEGAAWLARLREPRVGGAQR